MDTQHNLFTIAANNHDMQQVLWLMAKNLEANEDITGFNTAHIKDPINSRDLFHQVGNAIGEHLPYAFSTSPELPAYEKTSVLSPLYGPDGISLAVLDNYYVLIIDYYNKRPRDLSIEPIDPPDLDSLMLSLPRGTYGVALYRLPNVEKYAYLFTDISSFTGVHHGGAPLHNVKRARQEVLSQKEMERRQYHLEWEHAHSLEDPREAAKRLADASWRNMWVDSSIDSSNAVQWKSLEHLLCVHVDDRSPIDHKGLSATQVKKLLRTVRDLVALLPILPVLNTLTDGRGCAPMGTLLIGDQVRVVSSPQPSTTNGLDDPVALTAYTLDGRPVGQISHPLFDKYTKLVANPELGNAAVAILLPHIRASIWNFGQSILHLELEPIDLDQVLNDTKALLESDSFDFRFSSIVDQRD